MPAGPRPASETLADEPVSTAFKDRIDAALVHRLAVAITAAEASFDAARFEREATRGLDQLELKARITHVATVLEQQLPRDFERAAAVVGEVVRAIEDGDTPLEGWELWPVTDWVARAGREHPAVALELLARLTRHATGEFAVRPFIDDDPTGVLARFDRWVDEGDEHARRLVSEGTRPRLPWAPRLVVAAEDPGYAIPLLDRLVADPSEYVRRSVSNHLNDLTRIDTSLALAVAGRWAERSAAAGEIERARIVLDYAIHFVRADGRTGRKVFKWTTFELGPGDRRTLERRHAIRPITTRTYRSGTHLVEVQVNGVVVASGSFDLIVPSAADARA